MKVVIRAVAVVVMLALAWAGPLAPLAIAQQPAAPVEAQPAAPPPAQATPPPQMFQEEPKPVPARRGVDIYDVGAVAATGAAFPFRVALCGLGTAFSIVIFAMTFGSRPDATAEILEEGCGGKAPWIVRGSDIRPRPATSKAFDWETHRFDWEQ